MSSRLLVLSASMALALASGCSPGSDNRWLENGKAEPASPDKASSRGFGVRQIATTDAKALTDRWATPGDVAWLKTETTMRRNQPIATYIVFAGCKPDQAGACNVTADLDVTGPQGEAYASSRGMAVWVGHPPAPGRNLQLSERALALVVEEGEPLGPYKVKATVTDHVAGVTLRTEQTLTATAN